MMMPALYVDEKKRLPELCDQIIHNQKQLLALLRSRTEYIIKGFVPHMSAHNQAMQQWLARNVGPLSKLDKTLTEKDQWVQVWSFLLSKLDTNDPLGIDIEMCHRLDIATIMAKPPAFECCKASEVVV